jgi:hypothetical protein
MADDFISRPYIWDSVSDVFDKYRDSNVSYFPDLVSNLAEPDLGLHVAANRTLFDERLKTDGTLFTDENGRCYVRKGSGPFSQSFDERFRYVQANSFKLRLLGLYVHENKVGKLKVRGGLLIGDKYLELGEFEVINPIGQVKYEWDLPDSLSLYYCRLPHFESPFVCEFEFSGYGSKQFVGIYRIESRVTYRWRC